MPDTAELSERELEILGLVATGASNKEIAHALTISANTVKVHLRNIFAKIEVSSRTEAAMYAVQHGLVLTPTAEATQIHAAENGEGIQKTWPSSPIGERQRGALIFVLLLITGLLGYGVYVLLPRALPIRQPTPSGPVPAEEISRWQEQTALPQSLAGIAVAALGESIYAIGGDFENGTVSGQVLRYDISQEVWEELHPKPVPVADAQAAVLNGSIFVPGGRSSDNQIVDNLEIYNPQSNSWESGARLPAKRCGYALVAFEGRIYLFGGWDGSAYQADTWRYNPENDSWETLEPMGIARAYGGATISNRRIYVIGGRDTKGILKSAEIFNPDSDSDSWDRIADMPVPRMGMGVESVVDTIYVLGGQDSTRKSEVSLAYFPGQDTWQQFAQAEVQDWARMGLVLVGPRLYLLGGELDGVVSDRMMSYQAIYTISIPAIVK